MLANKLKKNTEPEYDEEYGDEQYDDYDDGGMPPVDVRVVVAVVAADYVCMKTYLKRRARSQSMRRFRG